MKKILLLLPLLVLYSHTNEEYYPELPYIHPEDPGELYDIPEEEYIDPEPTFFTETEYKETDSKQTDTEL